MAEQCIVCLDTLLHAAEPPPPPLPGDGSPNSDSANTSTPTATTAVTAVGAADSATATSYGKSGPSTVPAYPGQNGHRRSSDADDAVGETPNRDAGRLAATNGGSGDHAESHDDDNVAAIQICGHTLHDTCLREWTTKANSCPICRQSFHLVDVYDKIGGKRLSTYTVEDKKQVAEFDPQAWLDEYAEIQDEDVSTPCPVCSLADHEEVLLLCDGCDTPYHTHCIGLESVPEGAWFCMECVDLLGDAVPAPVQHAPISGSVRRGGRRSGAGRARNDFFPRTRHTMRRARRRARSDEWQGAWGQITGRIWDALNIDLDHDEDEALEEFRRIERLRDHERREFERWQERLDIARRLGAQDVFERNIPTAILHHASRHAGAPQSSTANPRTQIAAVQQTQEERRAWGDFDRARECDPTTTPNPRKRKSRSVTASPIEPPQEQERKLKRPRTRRIGASSEVASSSKSPSSVAVPAERRGRPLTTMPSASTPLSRPVPVPAQVATSANHAASPTQAAQSPSANGEPPSFLSSLLKEVEMSTTSDDENIRNLFGDPPLHIVDPSSPAGSSPAASAHNSPRAMSTTPPPQRTLRPSSPTLLSSHILPVYPPANYSPTRSAASPSSAGGGGDNSDSEGNASVGVNGNSNSNGNNTNRSPSTVEIRQPRPRRMPSVPVPRSLDSSPTRNALSLEMKESISSIVRTALNPHWKSSHLTADQYAAINRDVSRKLYEEVTNPAVVDTEARKLWEQKANREVARAVADLQV